MNGQNRWLYLIKRMVYRFFDDGIPQSAAELSYFLLFSMFPLLMFVNSMLAQLDLSIEGMQPVLEMLPKSLQQLIGGYIQQLTGTPSFSPMIVGLGLTLYFLSRAVRSMMRTVNDIYHVEISRGMVKDVLISFGITAGFLVSVVCSFVLVVAGRTIIRVVPKYLSVPPAVMDGLHDASFWVMIAFIFVFLMLFNKVVPNLHLRFREVWPGRAVLAGSVDSGLAWIFVLCGQYGAVFCAVRLSGGDYRTDAVAVYRQHDPADGSAAESYAGRDAAVPAGKRETHLSKNSADTH